MNFCLDFYLFQSFVEKLGGCLETSLAPLNRDPGGSLGQMISEFLKRDKNLNFKNQTDFKKQINTQ